METFEVATYNIRKAIGLDYKRDPRRILQAVADMRAAAPDAPAPDAPAPAPAASDTACDTFRDPRARRVGADLVALQEADYRFKQRRALFDTDEIEAITGLQPVDFGNRHPGLGWHGNVLLVSKAFDIQDARALDLPGLEPRGAVMVDLAWNGRPLRLLSAHLGLVAASRRMQAETLLAAAAPEPERITIIMGDFNGWGKARWSLKPFRDRMWEAHCGHSFPANRPITALDRIFYSGPVRLVSCGIVQTQLTEIASDHLPVRARFAATCSRKPAAL